MKKIYLELTNRCNLNCVMCYRKAWHESLKDMDDGHLNKLLMEIEENPAIETVVIGGIGEPTSGKNFMTTLARLDNKYLVVTTNGTRMDDELITAYIKHVDEIVISIDGLQDTFYKIRHIQLDDILTNIQRLKETKRSQKSQTPKITFQMVISRDNYLEIPKIIDLAGKYGASKVVYSNILPATLEDAPLAMYQLYEKEPLKSLLLEASRKSLPKGIELVIPEVMLKTERHCRFIEDQTMMITVDGYVVPCYRFAHNESEVVFGRQKEVQAHYFGHIQEKTLEEIWFSKEYVNYRHTALNNLYPSCMDCDLVDGCDMVNRAEMDCYGNVPSCADCLWARKIVYCI